MSFERKEWKYRDTITANDLNRVEDGIEEAISGGGGTPLIVNIVDGEGEVSKSLDRTWQEIRDAFPNVILRQASSVIGGESERLFSVISVREEPGLEETSYDVDALLSATSFASYSTNAPNGYPSR